MSIKNSMVWDLPEEETLLVFLNGEILQNVDRADAALGYADTVHPTDTWVCPVTGVECAKREHLLGKVEILHNGRKVVAVSS